jgi:transcription termination/antitermination protein NusG
VFCRLSGDVLGRIVTTPGVIRILGDGNRPLPVPTREIEDLQRVVASGLGGTPSQFLQVGQRVRVEVGPLRDTEGIMVKTKNRHLIISISLLCRSVAVEIDSEWVSVLPEVLLRQASKAQASYEAEG